MSAPTWKVLIGDVREMLRTLPEESVHCVVTSPPYWGLRDYGVAGQLGLEATPEVYVETMVDVFREVRRVLRKDGTAWVNMGDCYAGSWGAQSRGAADNSSSTLEHKRTDLSGLQIAAAQRHADRTGSADRFPGLKPKDLVGQPWRLAFALQRDGWWLRSAITWCKRAPMPESVTDRPTSATEMIFLLTKDSTYFYDAEAVREPAMNTPGGRLTRARLRAEGIHVPPSNRECAPGSAAEGSGLEGTAVPTSRNLRNFWLLGPEPLDEPHYAAFPSEIPRRAILAGTSAHGVCATCGAPWERVVEVEYRKNRPSAGNDPRSRKEDRYAESSDGGGWKGNNLLRDTRTTGWKPTCECGTTDVAPAVVLDPFLGSGTSGIVAVRYGRSFVGIELNQKYAAMATRRIAAEEREFSLVDHAERTRPRNAPWLFPDDPT